MRPLVASILFLALSPGLLAQTVLHTFQEPQPGAEAGAAVAVWTDINADGRAEWVVGAPDQDSAGGVDAGRATVLSGLDYTPMLVLDGSVPGARFGCAIANAGDTNLDGVDDLVIGARGEKAVRVYSGATLNVLRTFTDNFADFGAAVAGAGDADGDGWRDVVIGAPPGPGFVFVYSVNTGLKLWQYYDGSLNGLGYAVSSAGDVNNDGKADIVAGAPFTNAQMGGEGAAVVLDGPTGTVLKLHRPTAIAERGEELGKSVATVGDIDDDGYDDYALGAPWYAWIHFIDYNWVGVFSGATHTEIWRWEGPYDRMFGFSMANAGDVDFDGYDDLIVGDPYSWRATILSPKKDREITHFTGPFGTRYGTSVAAGRDTNGDSFRDFVVGDSDPDAPAAGSAVLFTWGNPVSVYCTAKPNSLGCIPEIFSAGTPSATLPVAFRIKARKVLNNKVGILIYGYSSAAIPFQGGTLCINPPIKRTSGNNSGGNPPPNDCSGIHSFEFNDHIRSGKDPQLVPGKEVFAQFWTRDMNSPPAGTGLTDAVSFLVAP